jgi:hypothetical protein
LNLSLSPDPSTAPEPPALTTITTPSEVHTGKICILLLYYIVYYIINIYYYSFFIKTQCSILLFPHIFTIVVVDDTPMDVVQSTATNIINDSPVIRCCEGVIDNNASKNDKIKQENRNRDIQNYLKYCTSNSITKPKITTLRGHRSSQCDLSMQLNDRNTKCGKCKSLLNNWSREITRVINSPESSLSSKLENVRDYIQRTSSPIDGLLSLQEGRDLVDQYCNSVPHQTLMTTDITCHREKSSYHVQACHGYTQEEVLSVTQEASLPAFQEPRFVVHEGVVMSTKCTRLVASKNKKSSAVTRCGECQKMNKGLKRHYSTESSSGKVRNDNLTREELEAKLKLNRKKNKALSTRLHVHVTGGEPI